VGAAWGLMPAYGLLLYFVNGTDGNQPEASIRRTVLNVYREDSTVIRPSSALPPSLPPSLPHPPFLITCNPPCLHTVEC